MQKNNTKDEKEYKMTKKIKVDEVIQKVAEELAQCEGEFIEEIANKVLKNKVKYVEGEIFRVDVD